jgi:hypothetical protein
MSVSVPGVDVAVPKIVAHKDVVIADCCRISGDYQYMLIGKAWFQVGWIAIAREGNKTKWSSYANVAIECQNCGSVLKDARTRAYYPGSFAPVDSVVSAVQGKES